MAKNNGRDWIIRILVVAAIAAVGAAVGFGRFQGGAEQKMQNMTARVDKHEGEIDEHSQKIAVLETRQEEILKGVQRIEKHLGIDP